MSSTCLQPSDARARGFADRIATGYTWSKKTAYRGLQSPDCPEGQGAGSVISSANDMIKWVKALINQEDPITRRVYEGLVKLRSFPHQHPSRIKPYTSPVIYAAGLDVYYYRGYMVAGHSGVIRGFASRFVFCPDLKLGAVVMGNSNGAGSISTTFIRKLIDEALGVLETDKPGRETPRNVSQAQPKKPKEKKNQKKNQKNTYTPGNEEKNSGKTVKDAGRDETCSSGQERSLEDYTGRYWNAGYRGMEVQIKDDHLFIDATDRSMGFTLQFRHLQGQTKYTAYLTDVVEEGEDPVEAEFSIEDDSVTRLGLRLEESISGLIWFDRTA
ncbi:hypothetical protein N7492_002434 [Penicillium capsulatum]|uniref:Beta-lactamase-related domain-containing protein n=1 Tax=Penicillium capsulatum TaxID=69766 RepID=A0A9W9IK20_9EURO|nr:hypothetical protein N7492_002434 [Penicillium capsulatum]